MKQSEIFPQTQKILGKELFETLQSNFSGDNKDFSQHLKNFLPELEVRYSFIPELAQLEYILSLKKSTNEESLPVKNCENVLTFYRDNQGKKLTLKPSLQLIKCRFPVWEIYKTLKKSKNVPSLIEFDLQPKIKSKYFYVIDNLENGPLVQNVSKKIYMLLEGILLGHSFGKIAEELFSQSGANDLNQSLQKVLSSNWVA